MGRSKDHSGAIDGFQQPGGKPVGPRVLVVDDEVAFAKNIASLLRHRRFDVETAVDGIAALEAFRTRPAFDVVLLDVMMPGLDGIQVLRKLKAMAPELEVIMLTGQATAEIGVEAIRAGAFDYLIKPCDIEDLTEKLRSATDVKQIRRHPLLWPRTMVAEVILYGFRRLTTDEPLIRAFEVFNSDRRKMAGETLFIVDSEDVLQGTITQQTLVDAARTVHAGENITWEELRSHPEWLPDRRIGDFLRREVVSTHPEMSLGTVAEKMIEHRMQSLPVVDGGRVTGIVRLRDVLRYLESDEAEEN